MGLLRLNEKIFKIQYINCCFHVRIYKYACHCDLRNPNQKRLLLFSHCRLETKFGQTMKHQISLECCSQNIWCSIGLIKFLLFPLKHWYCEYNILGQGYLWFAEVAFFHTIGDKFWLTQDLPNTVGEITVFPKRLFGKLLSQLKFYFPKEKSDITKGRCVVHPKSRTFVSCEHISCLSWLDKQDAYLIWVVKFYF